jgi:hypothetical protein
MYALARQGPVGHNPVFIETDYELRAVADLGLVRGRYHERGHPLGRWSIEKTLSAPVFLFRLYYGLRIEFAGLPQLPVHYALAVLVDHADHKVVAVQVNSCD